jgi:hypothetical protein
MRYFLFYITKLINVNLIVLALFSRYMVYNKYVA